MHSCLTLPFESSAAPRRHDGRLQCLCLCASPVFAAVPGGFCVGHDARRDEIRYHVGIGGAMCRPPTVWNPQQGKPVLLASLQLSVRRLLQFHASGCLTDIDPSRLPPSAVHSLFTLPLYIHTLWVCTFVSLNSHYTIHPGDAGRWWLLRAHWQPLCGLFQAYDRHPAGVDLQRG